MQKPSVRAYRWWHSQSERSSTFGHSQSEGISTFGRVPVDEGVHQRPAFAVVGGGQLQPIGLQSADHLALPGDAHGERPLVVLAGQRVQRSTAWSPGVEEHQQPQVWMERKVERTKQAIRALDPPLVVNDLNSRMMCGVEQK